MNQTNKKGFFGGFSDLPFIVLTFVLIIMTYFLFSFLSNGYVEAVKPAQDIGWEADWIAQSYASYPVGDESFIEFIQHASKEQVSTQLNSLADQTEIPHRSSLSVFIVREQEVLSCLYKREQVTPSSTQEPRYPCTPAYNERVGDFYQPSSIRLVSLLEDQTMNELFDEWIGEKKPGVSIGWVSGLHNQTILGVVVR